MSIASWAQPYMSSTDFDRIEKAIHEAELKTSGELVPVVVKCSSTFRHIPVTLTLLFALGFLLSGFPTVLSDSFNISETLILCGGFALSSLLASILGRFPFFIRVFTPRKDQIEQVEQRAINEFYYHKIHETKEATGILILISLYEHKAVVLGDDSISAKLKPEDWQEVIEKLIQGIKKKSIADGLIEGIKLSGELLNKHFPRQPGDSNELKNHLILKE